MRFCSDSGGRGIKNERIRPKLKLPAELPLLETLPLEYKLP